MPPTGHERAPLDPTIWHAIRRHGRIWRRCVIQGINRELQFRTHALLTIAVGLIELLLALIPVLLLYGYTDDVNGWSRADTIALVGMYQLTFGLICVFVERNVTSFSNLVQDGDLDMVVIRPVSGALYVTLRWVKPAELFAVISGFTVLVIGLARGDGWPGGIALVQAGVLVICGMILLTCIWTGLAWLSFWIVTTGPLPQVTRDVMSFGQFPISFYPLIVRFVLIAFVPVAFTSTFPVEALTGRGGWHVVLGGLALATVALVLLRQYWRFALRFYTSASS